VSITARELEDLVGKMLGEGVPAGVVSRVFELDIELVKDEQKKVRVRKYGTEDLNDYLEQMQWTPSKWRERYLRTAPHPSSPAMSLPSWASR